MTETITWDETDPEIDTKKKRILIERPETRTATLGRIDDELAILGAEISIATARKSALEEKRARIVAALEITDISKSV